MKEIKTDVCIVGGGPAGIMLGYLLAKQNISVLVLEKAANYERNFRGESISPDTVSSLQELGFMEAIEQHGYVKTKNMEVYEGGKTLLNVEFSQFQVEQKYTIDMPQSELINIILEKSMKYSHFSHYFSSTFRNIIHENDKVVGVEFSSKSDTFKVKSRLVVGADGRYGKVRSKAYLPAKVVPLARDILWFLLPRPPGWENTAKLSLYKNQHAIMLPTYPNHLRVGVNISKNSFGKIRKQPITELYEITKRLDPVLYDYTKQFIKTWSDTTLLDIFTMQVPNWSKDGLILIGDAAHTLTPILGQGVNHAITDAICLAPIVSDFICSNSKGVIPKEVFALFEKQRKNDVNFIHNFQVRQEKIMGFSSPIKTFIRRAFYRFMNQSQWLQQKIWGKILYGRQLQQKFIT